MSNLDMAILNNDVPDSDATEAYLKALKGPMGVIGLDQAGNYVFEEFLRELRWPNAGKVYLEMSTNDATISAVLYMIEQLVMRAGWKVEPAGETPIDIKKAEFLEQCMHDMEETWDDFILEVLSALVYGFSFHEIVYKKRQGKKGTTGASKYSDGCIGWRKMPIRSQSSLYGWEFDDEGEATAFIQQAPPFYNQVTIPLKKGMLFRTKRSRNNPEGRSLLRGAYRAWYFKKKIEEIEGIGIERDLAGLPLLTPPENEDIWSETPEARQKLYKATKTVQTVKRNETEGVVLPHGWELTLLSTGGQRQFDTNQIINRWDQRIAITLLADIVMLGADKVGSFALADVKKSLLSASLEAQLSRIADVINNTAVEQLFAYNAFEEGSGLPKLVPGEIETPDIEQLAKGLKAMGFDISVSLDITNAFLHMLSLPQLSETEFQEFTARQKTKEAKNDAMPREGKQHNKNTSSDGSDDEDGTDGDSEDS